MIGIPERSIVMSLYDAKEYSESRLILLNQKKDKLLNELDKIEIQIEMETQRLCMLNNPPKREDCCKCICCTDE